MQAEVHRDGIEALLPEWEQLFALDDEATPFSSAEWARAWWAHWAEAGDAVHRDRPRRRRGWSAWPRWCSRAAGRSAS